MKYYIAVEVEATGPMADLTAALQRAYDGGIAGNFQVLVTHGPSYMAIFERIIEADSERIRARASATDTSIERAAQHQLAAELVERNVGAVARPVIDVLNEGDAQCFDYGPGAFELIAEYKPKPESQNQSNLGWPAEFADGVVCRSQKELDEYLAGTNHVPIEQGGKTSTEICFAVGELPRHQLEGTAEVLGVQFDKWTSSDDLRASVIEAAHKNGGLFIYDDLGGSKMFGFGGPSRPYSSLQLLKFAVAAKVRYWDAVGRLEKSLLSGDNPTDRQADQLRETIENLATGLNEPEDAEAEIDFEVLESLVARLQLAAGQTPSEAPQG